MTDPIKWVERLMDVNEDSQFTEAQKEIIRGHLKSLHTVLIATNAVPSPPPIQS